MVDFNVPPCVGNEIEYVKQAIESHKICGDGQFTKKCHQWMEERFNAKSITYDKWNNGIRYGDVIV